MQTTPRGYNGGRAASIKYKQNKYVKEKLEYLNVEIDGEVYILDRYERFKYDQITQDKQGQSLQTALALYLLWLENKQTHTHTYTH
jgi:hypothetical protein